MCRPTSVSLVQVLAVASPASSPGNVGSFSVGDLGLTEEEADKLQCSLIADVLLAMLRDRRTVATQLRELTSLLSGMTLATESRKEVDFLHIICSPDAYDIEAVKEARKAVASQQLRSSKTLEMCGDVVLKPVDDALRANALDQQQVTLFNAVFDKVAMQDDPELNGSDPAQAATSAAAVAAWSAASKQFHNIMKTVSPRFETAHAARIAAMKSKLQKIYESVEGPQRKAFYQSFSSAVEIAVKALTAGNGPCRDQEGRR